MNNLFSIMQRGLANNETLFIEDYPQGQGQKIQQEQELVAKAETISTSIQKQFMDDVDSANKLNAFLNTALINSENSIKLLEDYSEKNSTLKLKLKERQGDILTNDRKTYYETEALENLKLWHRLLFIMYFIAVSILCLSLAFAPHNLSIKTSIIIALLSIIYPFYIDIIVQQIYDLWVSIVKRLPKNVYNDL